MVKLLVGFSVFQLALLLVAKPVTEGLETVSDLDVLQIPFLGLGEAGRRGALLVHLHPAPVGDGVAVVSAPSGQWEIAPDGHAGSIYEVLAGGKVLAARSCYEVVAVFPAPSVLVQS